MLICCNSCLNMKDDDELTVKQHLDMANDSLMGPNSHHYAAVIDAQRRSGKALLILKNNGGCQACINNLSEAIDTLKDW